ncbi:hypothetical protein [Hyalangium gracile]|uniref:hypothetical protein n=1 Tax=Hyalangium gracile TaxID=394092 RepID=UPI001CCCB84B|nr:hypothetical protein [Hyalangium gracile]
MSFAHKLRAWMPLHENGVSRAVHLLGGYLFTFSLLVPLSWARLDAGGLSLTGAHALVLAVAVYCLTLEWTAGLLASLLLVPTLAAAEAVSRLPTGTALGVAFGVMAFRFAIVVGGHVLFEKKTHGLSLGGPILFFVEPVYLFTLGLFAMGLKRELLREVGLAQVPVRPTGNTAAGAASRPFSE